MLPASARVRSRTEHRLVATRGRRARRGPLVVHLLVDPVGSPDGTPRAAELSLVPDPPPARAGVVAGRKVGPAVVRNRVKRRLRELLRIRLPELPAGTLLVVRALPGAGAADFATLGNALDAALRSCERVAPRRPTPREDVR
jgi:ribonuclease P protein component